MTTRERLEAIQFHAREIDRLAAEVLADELPPPLPPPPPAPLPVIDYFRAPTAEYPLGARVYLEWASQNGVAAKLDLSPEPAESVLLSGSFDWYPPTVGQHTATLTVFGASGTIAAVATVAVTVTGEPSPPPPPPPPAGLDFTVEPKSPRVGQAALFTATWATQPAVASTTTLDPAYEAPPADDEGWPKSSS